MRKYFLVLICLLIASITQAQNIEPYFSLGRGSYSMNQVKTLFNNISEQIPFPVKTLDYFPDYQNYDGGVNIKYNESSLVYGIGVSYASTGGKANVADYSGSYNVDLITSNVRLMASVGYRIASTEFLDIYSKLRIGYSFSELSIEERYTLYKSVREDDFSFNSESLSFEPLIEASKAFKYFGVFMNVGYLIDCKGALHLPDDKDVILQIDNKNITTNWSGYRVRLGVKVMLQNIL